MTAVAIEFCVISIDVDAVSISDIVKSICPEPLDDVEAEPVDDVEAAFEVSNES